MRVQFIGIALCLLSLIACTPPADSVLGNNLETQAGNSIATWPAASPQTTRPRLQRDPRIEELRPNLLHAINNGVADLEDVDSVSRTRFQDGTLEIVLRTKSAEADDQAKISWMVLNTFANPLARIGRETLAAVAGGPFHIALTVYSIDRNYRYRSATDWDTLLGIAQKTISYQEWQSLSGAGFK